MNEDPYGNPETGTGNRTPGDDDRIGTHRGCSRRTIGGSGKGGRSMIRRILVMLGIFLCSTLWAQERVTPRESKGGQKQGELWADVPESFRNVKIPSWPVPSDLKQWEHGERERTRATLLRCLGELPPRPDPARV